MCECPYTDTYPPINWGMPLALVELMNWIRLCCLQSIINAIQ